MHHSYAWRSNSLWNYTDCSVASSFDRTSDPFQRALSKQGDMVYYHYCQFPTVKAITKRVEARVRT